jgi:uncharacterized membrane protein
MHRAIELAASGIEVFAVAVIVIGFFFATVKFLFRASQKKDQAFDTYKLTLGRSMLLGLTFLVAADVISTVALAPTLSNVAILGILIVLRTFLSWSLIVELEGHWPWSSTSAGEQSEFVRRSGARERGDAYMDEPGSPARWGIEGPAPFVTSAREDPSRREDRHLVSSFSPNSFAGDEPTFRRSE